VAWKSGVLLDTGYKAERLLFDEGCGVVGVFYCRCNTHTSFNDYCGSKEVGP